jgi:hypothetical protein
MKYSTETICDPQSLNYLLTGLYRESLLPTLELKTPNLLDMHAAWSVIKNYGVWGMAKKIKNLSYYNHIARKHQDGLWIYLTPKATCPK